MSKDKQELDCRGCWKSDPKRKKRHSIFCTDKNVNSYVDLNDATRCEYYEPVDKSGIEPCDNVWCVDHVSNVDNPQRYDCEGNCISVNYTFLNCPIRKKFQSRSNYTNRIRKYVEATIKESADGYIPGGDMLSFLNAVDRGE